MGSYCGSKSFSRSTPSLLFGRSMMWPLDASTMKSLPRNLFSVLDFVGDSTTTRFLPLALSPRLASISASSISGSGASGRALAKRPRRFGAASARSGVASPGAAFTAGFAFALVAGFFFFGFSSAGAAVPSGAVRPAAPSVRDFLVAMRDLSGGCAIRRLERHARRHLARARHLDRPLLERRQGLEHALELVGVQRSARAKVHEIAPRLGRERLALLGREHAVRAAPGGALRRLQGRPVHGRAARGARVCGSTLHAGEAADPEGRHLDVVGGDALLLERLGQRLERQLVTVQVLLELAREQPQYAT